MMLVRLHADSQKPPIAPLRRVKRCEVRCYRSGRRCVVHRIHYKEELFSVHSRSRVSTGHSYDGVQPEEKIEFSSLMYEKKGLPLNYLLR